MALEDLFFHDYADDNDPENENRLRFGRAQNENRLRFGRDQTQDLLPGGANDSPAPGARTRFAGGSSMFGGMNGWAPDERPVDMGEAPAPVQPGTTPMRYTDESITRPYPNTFDQLNRSAASPMYDRTSGQELPPAQQRSPEGQRPGIAGSLGQLLGVPQMGSERFSRALAAGLAGMQGNFGLSTFGRGMGSAMQGGQNYEDAERNFGLKAKTQGDLTDYRNRSLDETSRYHTEMLKRGNYLPGTSTDAEGNVVPGMYDTRTGKFTAGPQITPTGRPGAAGSMTERVLGGLMAQKDENGKPKYSYEEALSLAKRGNRDPELNLQRERLAAARAEKDPEYFSNPKAAVQKWREFYGLDAVKTPNATEGGRSPQELRGQLEEAIKKRPDLKEQLIERAKQHGISTEGLD